MPEPCVLHRILHNAPLAPKGHATRTRTPIAVEGYLKTFKLAPELQKKRPRIRIAKQTPKNEQKSTPKGVPKRLEKYKKGVSRSGFSNRVRARSRDGRALGQNSVLGAILGAILGPFGGDLEPFWVAFCGCLAFLVDRLAARPGGMREAIK